jgi:hypothetical protein
MVNRGVLICSGLFRGDSFIACLIEGGLAHSSERLLFDHDSFSGWVQRSSEHSSLSWMFTKLGAKRMAR